MPESERAEPTSWPIFGLGAPELAAYAMERLAARPCYLATIRRDRTPRVHPVTPIVAPEVGLFVFTEPDSPKARDLNERHSFALHNGVPDDDGTGGELAITGWAERATDPRQRAAAVAAASYEPADRYLLFHLLLTDVRAHTYLDAAAPVPTRWSAGARAGSGESPA